MKKTVITAVLLGIFLILPYAYAAEPVKPPEIEKKAVVVPKEFISEVQPAEVEKLIGGIAFAFPGEEKSFYSGKNPGVYDYLLRDYLTDIGTVHALFEMTCVKDAKGNLIPWQCNGVPVALVFEDQKVSWFKSLEVKKIFAAAMKQEATK